MGGIETNMTKIRAAMAAMIRPLIEPHVGDILDVDWFLTKEEAIAVAPYAEIGWFDMYDKADMAVAITAASQMKWLNSIYAGVDGMPLDLLAQRGVVTTNGAGINALTIAEYVVMAMLVVAKRYDEVVRAKDRHEWLMDSPGKVELAGTRALLLGAGAIGSLIQPRLAAFDVAVTTVRRSPTGAHELGPEQWRGRLGEFDWIILAVPATAETEAMIGPAELAAMQPTATIVNIARGSVIDQAALVSALQSGQIGHAFLDVTDPEPLPAEHILWTLPNCQISMHLSGRAQNMMFFRSAERFLQNLARYRAGEPLHHQIDYQRGY
jgi:phosphoglycerate dehydrogenase-like enzyme